MCSRQVPVHLSVLPGKVTVCNIPTFFMHDWLNNEHVKYSQVQPLDCTFAKMKAYVVAIGNRNRTHTCLLYCNTPNRKLRYVYTIILYFHIKLPGGYTILPGLSYTYLHASHLYSPPKGDKTLKHTVHQIQYPHALSPCRLLVPTMFVLCSYRRTLHIQMSLVHMIIRIV